MMGKGGEGVREDRFVLIGGFSGASGREKKRAFSARFLFPEEKIKAGNVFVNDWPDPCELLQPSILGILLQRC